MREGSERYGQVRDGAVAVRAGRIAWMGPERELPGALGSKPAETLDARGGWVTPGLIDCHTHLVFGANRAHEFERRLQGATYEQIAREGGGILSTVRATRGASDEELLEAAIVRLKALRSQGVTTIEVKSGYGLDVDNELRMLRIAVRAGEACQVTCRTTLLAAHVLPPEYADDREGYMQLVCDEMIPRAAREGLAQAVDAFCEGIAFSPDECARVLEAGAAAGLAGRLHADQLSDLGGAALAARMGARSADHLEYASVEGVRAMAEAGTVAVLLPGAFYFLGEKQRPPVDALRREGVTIALATDLNPGSSPLVSPLLAMNLGALLFGLTAEEALAGMTRNAARVLGLEGERGVLEVGAVADLALWDVGRPAELAYWLGFSPCRAVVRAGRVTRLDSQA